MDTTEMLKFVESLKTVSPYGMVLFLCLGIGFLLKNIPAVNNLIIPLVCIPVGAVAFLGICPTEDVPLNTPKTWAWKLVVGSVIGMAAVGGHQAITKIKSLLSSDDERIAELDKQIAEIREQQTKKVLAEAAEVRAEREADAAKKADAEAKP